MLVARLSARAGADVAHIDPKRLLRDAFEPGDTWFVTGDIVRRSTSSGDYWFVDRQDQMIADAERRRSRRRRIEDALYELPERRAVRRRRAPAPDDPALRDPDRRDRSCTPGTTLDLAALSAAVATLPEYARPRRVRVVDTMPLTDGYPSDQARVEQARSRRRSRRVRVGPALAALRRYGIGGAPTCPSSSLTALRAMLRGTTARKPPELTCISAGSMNSDMIRVKIEICSHAWTCMT